MGVAVKRSLIRIVVFFTVLAGKPVDFVLDAEFFALHLGNLFGWKCWRALSSFDLIRQILMLSAQSLDMRGNAHMVLLIS